MRRIILFILLILAAEVRGQQDPQFSHYMVLGSLYNPAHAGTGTGIAVNLVSRNQWLKFDGAPKTQVLTIDAPINLFGSQAGIGFKILSDQYAFVKDLILGGMFSKSIVMPVGVLNIGLSVDLFSKTMNPQWQFPDQTENLITQQAQGMILDLDLGIFYFLKNFYTGFSVTHLTAPKFVLLQGGESQTVGLVRHFYFTTGFSLPISSTVDFAPSILVKTDAHVLQEDINLMLFLYNKKIWAGVSYRNGESIVAFVGTSFIKDINLGISYDALINPINRVSVGSFEVYVGYTFSILKTEKPQYFHNVKTL